MAGGRKIEQSPDWAKNQETYREFLRLINGRAPDPEFLRGVRCDGVVIVFGRCPQCGEWGELDGEQLRGIVSTHHDTEDGGCGYHNTVNWIERYTA